MYRVSRPQAAGLLAILGVYACADPITEVKIDDWQPELAMPLIETSFTLRDALEGTDFDEFLEEGQDGGLRIGISEELFDYRVGDEVPILPLVFPLITPETTIDIARFGFDLPVSLLDMTEVMARVELRNDYPLPATVTITSENIDIEGAPLQHVFTIPANSTAVDSFPATASRFELSDDGTVTMRYDADLVGGQPGVQLSGGTFALEYEDFAYAEGALSDIGFEVSLDSTAFSFFDAFEPGTISIVDPRATLTIENSVGAPIRFSSPAAEFGYRDGSRRELRSPLSNGIDMVYPSITEGAVAKTTVVPFDRSNGNFVELFNDLPTFFDFDLDCEVNPDDAPERFFIYRDASVRGRLDVDVPLALRFDGFEVDRDFPIDGSSFENAIDAEFALQVENGFGLGARLQITFLDATGEEIADVFPESIEVMQPALVDALGKSIDDRDFEVKLPVSAAAIVALQGASTARVTLQLDTPPASATGGAEFTHLYYDNAIAVELGALITLDGDAAMSTSR